jgi:hypothetical protein
MYFSYLFYIFPIRSQWKLKQTKTAQEISLFTVDFLTCLNESFTTMAMSGNTYGSPGNSLQLALHICKTIDIIHIIKGEG